MTEPRVGCGAAIVVGSRILLTKRLTEPEAGCWGLPGGKVDLYERAADACRREIAEELGIAIEPGDLLCLVDQIDPAREVHWIAPVYLVTSFSGEPTLKEPDKHGGLEWFALDAPPAELTTPTRAALDALRQRYSAAAAAASS